MRADGLYTKAGGTMAHHPKLVPLISQQEAPQYHSYPGTPTDEELVTDWPGNGFMLGDGYFVDGENLFYSPEAHFLNVQKQLFIN